MLRETWPNINMLAEEIYAILHSDLPLNITGPVTITNENPGQPALSLRQPAESDQPPIKVNRLPLAETLPATPTTSQAAQPQTGSSVLAATVVSVSPDALQCTIDGQQATVKKPPILRVSTPPRPGTLALAYNTADGQQRTASFDASTEDQIVVPVYLVGDVLYTAQTAAGELIDLNVDGRVWATKIPTDDP